MDQIEGLCAAFGVGARIPAHRDLMVRFDTSERTVLAALAELQRRGRIVRRAGSGTYVASVVAAGEDHPKPSRPEERPQAEDGVRTVVVVGSHDQGYFSRAIDMAFRYAQELALGVTFEPANFERLKAMPRHSDAGESGILILGSQNIHAAEELCETYAHIVGVGDRKPEEHVSFPCVHPDNVTGGYLAARHLIDRGHTRLAYIMANNNPRLWGHVHAVRLMREAGYDVQSVTIERDTFDEWQKNPSLGREFFSNPDHPTGFCVWNDTDAIRLLTFLMSIGLNVPEDISIVGYDNLPVAQVISPALTTIETRLEDQVKLALHLLTNPSSIPRHSIVVEPELLVRESTR